MMPKVSSIFPFFHFYCKYIISLEFNKYFKEKIMSLNVQQTKHQNTIERGVFESFKNLKTNFNLSKRKEITTTNGKRIIQKYNFSQASRRLEIFRNVFTAQVCKDKCDKENDKYNTKTKIIFGSKSIRHMNKLCFS